MEIYLSKQLHMLWVSLAVGVCMGVFYDLIRVGRICVGIDVGANIDFTLPRPRTRRKILSDGARSVLELIHIAVGDIFFFFVLACVTAVYIYVENDGRFRAFAILGMLAGFLAYRYTIGKPVLKLLKILCEILLFLITHITYIICMPVFFVLNKIILIFFAFFRKIILILSSIYGTIRTSICSYFVYKRVMHDISEGYMRSIHFV